MAGSSEAGCSAGWVWQGNGNAGSWELQQVGFKQLVFAAASSALCSGQSRAPCAAAGWVSCLRVQDAFAGTALKVHLAFVLNDHSNLLCLRSTAQVFSSSWGQQDRLL